MLLMDNFRVFEPIVSFSAEAHARSLSWIIFNDLRESANPLYGSAGATSILTIIGVAFLLTPVLLRTWRDFKLRGIKKAIMYTKTNSRMTITKSLSFALVGLWLFVAAFPFAWTFWGVSKFNHFFQGRWMYAIWELILLTKPVMLSQVMATMVLGSFRVFGKTFLILSIVVFFTVIISITFGTLGGYALASSGFRYAFWILMAALVFRAMPHITLVSGYLLPFLNGIFRDIYQQLLLYWLQ